MEGIFERGTLIFASTMVSVHLKELECIDEKLKYKTLEVMQPRIKSKSKLPYTQSFTVVID